MTSKKNQLENLDSKSLLNSFIREFPYKNDNYINTEEDEENNIFQNIPKRNRFDSFENNINFEEEKQIYDFNFFDDSLCDKKTKNFLITSLKKKDFDFSDIDNDFEKEEIFSSCKKISKNDLNHLNEIKKNIFKEDTILDISKRKNLLKFKDLKEKKKNLFLVNIFKIGKYWKNKSFITPNIFRLIKNKKKNSEIIFEEILDFSKKEILIQNSEKEKNKIKCNLEFEKKIMSK